VEVKHALRVLAIAAVFVGLAWFARSIDWAKLGKALSGASLAPLVGVVVLNFVQLFGMALSWHVMLLPRHRVPPTSLFRYTITAFAASVIAPVRAGELVRLWALERRHGVPIADAAAVALAEKLLTALVMIALVAPVPLLVDVPSWVGRAIAIAAAIAVVVVAVLWFAVGRVHGTRWWQRVIRGMHVLRSRRLALAIAVLVATLIVDIAMVTLAMRAVGVEAPIAASILVLFSFNLAILVPSTPAQVGALELGVLAATRALGIADEPALAFALLYHALQIFPLLGVGMVLAISE
jgi:uncharacterized membrane protein YbhN (UPF0104 family)